MEGFRLGLLGFGDLLSELGLDGLLQGFELRHSGNGMQAFAMLQR